MWFGKKPTEELRVLAELYAANNNGESPDGYDELCYEAMTYEEFISYIKECLATGKKMIEVVS